jgi:hypothetical protein
VNDDIGCDESKIIIKNEALVGRVNALIHDLEKAYGGKAKLDLYWEANGALLIVRVLGILLRKERMLL